MTQDEIYYLIDGHVVIEYDLIIGINEAAEAIAAQFEKLTRERDALKEEVEKVRFDSAGNLADYIIERSFTTKQKEELAKLTAENAQLRQNLQEVEQTRGKLQDQVNSLSTNAHFSKQEKEALRRRCEDLEGMVEKVREWISVKDRLPQEQEEVLFLIKNVRKPSSQLAAPSVHSGFYFKEGLFKSWIDIRDNWTATHWQPMPNPPIK